MPIENDVLLLEQEFDRDGQEWTSSTIAGAFLVSDVDNGCVLVHKLLL